MSAFGVLRCLVTNLGLGGGVVVAAAASLVACGVEPPLDSASSGTTSQALAEDMAGAEVVNPTVDEDPLPLLDAKLLPSSFGAKTDADTIDVEVSSFIEDQAEVVFLVRAIDEGQRVVRLVSGGVIEARGRMTAGLEVGDLGIARAPLAISGVLTLAPMLVTEAGARTPPLERALRVSYHPANGRLVMYDDATRAAVYRGGALTDEVFRAAGGRGAEVVAGYRGGARVRPEHEVDGEPDPEHNVAAGVTP